MSMYSYAAKRLWAKRVTKIGLFLSKIFAPITYIIKFPLIFWRADSETKLGYLFIIAFITAIGTMVGVTINQEMKNNPADPISIKESIDSKDGCISNTSANRFNLSIKSGRPITFKDIENVKRDCQKYWEKEEAISKQKKVLGS